MLGMFMVLPVLATYGGELKDSTPFLIGLAIGVYGLTQALFQIPFGYLSDKIGRKPIIYGGLLVFALGSLVAAEATSIWGVILGRVIQGGGAISAVVMALLSDLTREQHRTKGMAVIGITIGLSFAVAMILGPFLTHLFGLSGLFVVTAILALLGILIVLFVVPNATARHNRETGVTKQAILPILRNKELLRLDLGIFTLHATLMASFIALPLALVHRAGLPKEQHWWVYLTALLIGFFAMIPFIIYAEKKRHMKRVLRFAIFVLFLCELYFWYFSHSLVALVIGMTLFFTAFNLLEASLPSLISKVAPAGSKGTAMGVYSTSQFLGSALGGILGGALYQHFGFAGVFGGCALLIFAWFLLALSMKEPPYVTSWHLPLKKLLDNNQQLTDKLKVLPGVTDAVIIDEETALYVKVDVKQLDRTAFDKIVESSVVANN
ncbi:UNVERIFIED_CONTAM: hypothetical protein GTU68_041413 [Idotea baltica]|nr:hypothetical protein [Idotea baltica]